MSRWDRLHSYQTNAENECKAGGDPAKGLVMALLAVSEAIVQTEVIEVKVDLGGSLTVDS